MLNLVSLCILLIVLHIDRLGVGRDLPPVLVQPRRTLVQWKQGKPPSRVHLSQRPAEAGSLLTNPPGLQLYSVPLTLGPQPLPPAVLIKPLITETPRFLYLELRHTTSRQKCLLRPVHGPRSDIGRLLPSLQVPIRPRAGQSLPYELLVFFRSYTTRTPRGVLGNEN